MRLYQTKGFSTAEAQKKTRQSWVVSVGKLLENLIILFLEEFCQKHNLKVVKGDMLKKSNLDYELSRVRRNIEVIFDKYSLLPDADIVIYQLEGREVIILTRLSPL